MTYKTERSQALYEAAQRVLPGGVNSPVRAFRAVGGTPLFIEQGAGAHVWDADGNRYIDYVLSWGPLVLGHAPQAVTEAITRQALLGTSFGAPTKLETQLAELVIEIMPNIERLRFVNSGTEATMSAIRLARAYTSRPKILKFAGHYHGHGDMLLVQAGSGVATLGLPDSPGVPAGAVQDTLTAPFNDLEAVREAFHSHPDQIAAIIVEPIAGNMGFVPPIHGYLEGLRALAYEHGALLIFDEVMTGFRVAPGGAQALHNIKPDLTTLGKVIGGGLPVGAYGGRAEIMDNVAPIGKMYQAGTLSGNPLAMAAGIAALTEWHKPGVFNHAAAAAERLITGMKQIAAAAGVPLQARNIGTMFGFFFNNGLVTDYDSAKKSDVVRYRRVFHALLERGVYFAPSQFEAGFTSSAHDDATIDETLAAFRDALKATQ